MEIKDGKVSIGVSYGVKVPGTAKYTSHEKSTWLTVEYSLDGVEADVAVDKSLELEAKLDTAVKLAVLSAVGLQPEFVAEGVIVPQWPADKPEPPKPTRQGGGGNGQRPAAGGRPGGASANAPRQSIVVEGQQYEVIDARGLKAQGVYAANAPDFRTPGRDGPAWWLKRRDGSVDPVAAQIAEAFDSEPAEAPF